MNRRILVPVFMVLIVLERHVHTNHANIKLNSKMCYERKIKVPEIHSKGTLVLKAREVGSVEGVE